MTYILDQYKKNKPTGFKCRIALAKLSDFEKLSYPTKGTAIHAPHTFKENKAWGWIVDIYQTTTVQYSSIGQKGAEKWKAEVKFNLNGDSVYVSNYEQSLVTEEWVVLVKDDTDEESCWHQLGRADNGAKFRTKWIGNKKKKVLELTLQWVNERRLYYFEEVPYSKPVEHILGGYQIPQDYIAPISKIYTSNGSVTYEGVTMGIDEVVNYLNTLGFSGYFTKNSWDFVVYNTYVGDPNFGVLDFELDPYFLQKKLATKSLYRAEIKFVRWLRNQEYWSVGLRFYNFIGDGIVIPLQEQMGLNVFSPFSTSTALTWNGNITIQDLSVKGVYSGLNYLSTQMPYTSLGTHYTIGHVLDVPHASGRYDFGIIDGNSRLYRRYNSSGYSLTFANSSVPINEVTNILGNTVETIVREEDEIYLYSLDNNYYADNIPYLLATSSNEIYLLGMNLNGSPYWPSSNWTKGWYAINYDLSPAELKEMNTALVEMNEAIGRWT